MPVAGQAAHMIPRANAEVDVPCWCESTMLFVSLIDVRRGLTRPCEKPACKRMDREARS